MTSPGAEVTIETHGDDAHLLLAHVARGPAFVFGSSIGALIGLDLAARHPDVVVSLVADEPPLLQLLPASDHLAADPALAAGRTDEEKLAAFAATIGATRKGTRAPAQNPAATANAKAFMSQDAAAVGRYHLDLDALRDGSTRVVPAGGRNSRAFFPHRCAEVLAARLGAELVEFPGDHAGYAREPRGFADQLRSVIRAD